MAAAIKWQKTDAGWESADGRFAATESLGYWELFDYKTKRRHVCRATPPHGPPAGGPCPA